jgi:predicted aspartyl protease
MICTLSLNGKEIPTHALIDCGATGYAFIDQDFAHYHKLPLCPLKTPHALEVIDG